MSIKMYPNDSFEKTIYKVAVLYGCSAAVRRSFSTKFVWNSKHRQNYVEHEIDGVGTFESAAPFVQN